MVLYILLILSTLVVESQTVCDPGKVQGSCMKVKDDQFQIRGVKVQPMMQYLLNGFDLRRKQTSDSKLHYIPPSEEEETTPKSTRTKIVDSELKRGRALAKGSKTLEYNLDPIDSFERAVIGEEFETLPALSFAAESVDQRENLKRAFPEAVKPVAATHNRIVPPVHLPLPSSIASESKQAILQNPSRTPPLLAKMKSPPYNTAPLPIIDVHAPSFHPVPPPRPPLPAAVAPPVPARTTTTMHLTAPTTTRTVATTATTRRIPATTTASQSTRIPPQYASPKAQTAISGGTYQYTPGANYTLNGYTTISPKSQKILDRLMQGGTDKPRVIDFAGKGDTRFVTETVNEISGKPDSLAIEIGGNLENEDIYATDPSDRRKGKKKKQTEIEEEYGEPGEYIKSSGAGYVEDPIPGYIKDPVRGYIKAPVGAYGKEPAGGYEDGRGDVEVNNLQKTNRIGNGRNLPVVRLPSGDIYPTPPPDYENDEEDEEEDEENDADATELTSEEERKAQARRKAKLKKTKGMLANGKKKITPKPLNKKKKVDGEEELEEDYENIDPEDLGDGLDLEEYDGTDDDKTPASRKKTAKGKKEKKKPLKKKEKQGRKGKKKSKGNKKGAKSDQTEEDDEAGEEVEEEQEEQEEQEDQDENEENDEEVADDEEEETEEVEDYDYKTDQDPVEKSSLVRTKSKKDKKLAKALKIKKIKSNEVHSNELKGGALDKKKKKKKDKSKKDKLKKDKPKKDKSKKEKTKKQKPEKEKTKKGKPEKENGKSEKDKAKNKKSGQAAGKKQVDSEEKEDFLRHFIDDDDEIDDEFSNEEDSEERLIEENEDFETPPPLLEKGAPGDSSHIDRNVKTAYSDSKSSKFYYPPKSEVPLPTCFHNPSGYVCCNLMLNNLVEESVETVKADPDFNMCNIGKIANMIQTKSEDMFEHPFESVVALGDFAQTVHFAGDLVCKLEIDGKYMLVYGTPYDADSLADEEAKEDEDEKGDSSRRRRVRRKKSLPIHSLRM